MTLNQAQKDKFKKTLIIIERDANRKKDSRLINLFSNVKFLTPHTVTQEQEKLKIPLCAFCSDDYFFYIDNPTLKNLLLRQFRGYFNKISPEFVISDLKINIDFNKIIVPDLTIKPIDTGLKQVDSAQKELLAAMHNVKSSIDCQNIGNTARTIMLLLSKEVYDKEKHPSDYNCSGDNSKNQLLAVIDNELRGGSNKELRDIANSAINFVDDSIDIMNKLTHKTDASKPLAEMCVTSTFAATSIIRIINSNIK